MDKTIGGVFQLKTDDEVYRLRNAIVRQAAEDYYDWRRKYYLFGLDPIPELNGMLHKKYREGGQDWLNAYVKHFLARYRLTKRWGEDAVTFFRGEWYPMLCENIDGNYLLRKLDGMAYADHIENKKRASKKGYSIGRLG